MLNVSFFLLNFILLGFITVAFFILQLVLLGSKVVIVAMEFLVKLEMAPFHFVMHYSIGAGVSSQSSMDYCKQLFFQFSIFQRI